MKMTMTNEELAVNVNVLSGAQETGVLGLAIAKNLRRLKDEGKEYLDIKNAAYKEYGQEVKLSDGRGLYSVPKDKMADFEATFADLKDVECEVDMVTVSEDTFCSGGLTSGQMEALLWMMGDKT